MPAKPSAKTKPAAAAKARSTPKGGRHKEALSRERIEQAALVLVNTEGLEGFSIRKLGEALGCEAMSLYHHFPSKAHILDALVDRLVAGIELPPPEVEAMARINAIAQGWRKLARQHPRFFPFLSMHRLNSATGVAFLEEIMRALQQAGFDNETAARLFRVVNYYLVGAALDEIAGYANGPASVNPVSDADLAEQFPAIAAAGRFFTPAEFDRTFEFGLARLLGTAPEA